MGLESVLENSIKWEPFDVSEFENGLEAASSVLSKIDDVSYGASQVRDIPISIFKGVERESYEDVFSRELGVPEFNIKQEYSHRNSPTKPYSIGELEKFYPDAGAFHIGHREIPIELAQFKNAEQMIETKVKTKEKLERVECKTSQPPPTDEKKSSTKKTFKCDHCVMSFTRPSDLQRHLLIHSNTKPYKCEECDREFTWFGNYQKHLLSHVNSNGSNPAGSRPFSAMFSLLARDQLKDLFVKVRTCNV